MQPGDSFSETLSVRTRNRGVERFWSLDLHGLSQRDELGALFMPRIVVEVMVFGDWATVTACYGIVRARNCSAGTWRCYYSVELNSAQGGKCTAIPSADGPAVKAGASRRPIRCQTRADLTVASNRAHFHHRNLFSNAPPFPSIALNVTWSTESSVSYAYKTSIQKVQFL